MRKALLIFSLLAIVTAFMTSCSPAASGDPKVVLKTFAERIAKKDFNGAAKLATANSKSTIEMVKMGMEMAEKMKSRLPENDPIAQLNQAEFSEAKINGNTAIVTLTNKVNKDQPPVDFTLVKENGAWKVDFSMAALTNMGRQQIKQRDGDINLDSLAQNLRPEDLENATKMADSIMKNLDPKKLEEIQKQLEKFKQQQ